LREGVPEPTWGRGTIADPAAADDGKGGKLGAMPPARGLSREPAPFRGLSVPPKAGEQEGRLLGAAAGKPKRRKPKQKRVHLLKNPLVCEHCLGFWREGEFKGNEKKLFSQVKDGPPFRHRGCPGAVRPYYDLNRAVLVRLSIEKIFVDPAYRDFFPSMGNLVRDDVPDSSHHNSPCTGACCATSKDGSLGPEPTEAAAVVFTSSFPTLAGWEEQAHKTCAAASVAGALNGALRLCCGPPGTRSFQRAPSPEAGGAQRGRSSGAVEKSTEGDAYGRILEQDVIEYYCKWSREAGQIGCHAALRGSCGLIPSTRKIGNPRLLRACHAVGTSFISNEMDRHRRGEMNADGRGRGVGGSVVCLPQVAQRGAAGSDDDDDEDDEDQDDDASSPIETLRLMGNWMCRDRIEEGGRCAPDDDDGVEDNQWQRVKDELSRGSAVLLHFRNHYALVFAAREWRCQSTGAWRRHLLTATQKQRPHVWFCFRQLRADMVYSKVNQMLLIRAAVARGSGGSTSALSRILGSRCLARSSSGSSTAASACDTATSDEGRCSERRGV